MDYKDKLSEALKKAQGEREKSSKRAAPEMNSEYVAPVIPKRAEAAQNGIDARLVAYSDPKSCVAEQYRSLMTHLLSLPEVPGLKVLAVTSSSAQEGKTITALNLAIVLAQNLEKRVLVLDCNLRRPMADLYLNMSAKKGLSDILVGAAAANEAIYQTTIPNLSCICAGQTETNPTELLTSAKMESTLASLKSRFDYVILDTPAVIPYADALLISRVADGVLLVVKTEKTRREVVARSEALLKAVGAKLLGVALTNIQYHIPEYIHKHL